MVRFQSLGSVQEVGASCHLVEMDGLSIMLDCGLHPKHEGLEALPAFDLLERQPDACVITHAHHDHSAALPYLSARYPNIMTYATKSTLRILDRMLHNSVSVMEKIRDERGVTDYPLYGHEEVGRVLRKAYGINHFQRFALRPDSNVRVTFYPAGHVLGGACVNIQSPGHNVFYTSDISWADQELMPAFEIPSCAANVDTLIIESTYGANPEADHYVYAEQVDGFAKAVKQVLDREGVVLVPSFALGRTQEMLNVIARLQYDGRIPDVPVYASGLGRAIYEVYERNRELLRAESHLYPLAEFESVGDVWDPRNVKRLLRYPGIIVATSGMMLENTPSAMIAKQMVKEPRHGILFVGYCDPETLGHRVKHARKGDKLVFQPGEPAVELKIDTIESFHFSAHAPRSALQQVAEQFHPKNIVFVHGDAPAIEWMYENCRNGANPHAPAVGEVLTLEA